MRIVSDFIWGMLLPLRASALIVAHPRLWPWVAVPIVITVLTYYFLWADLFLPWQLSISNAAANGVAGLFGADSMATLKSGVQTLINILLACFFWIVALLSFSTLSNLATLPVNDFLAEATEPLCTPPLGGDYQGGLAGFLRALWVDLRKSIASTVIILVTFIFSWIPIMNFVALLLVAFALTLQYSGYASTRRNLGVRKSFGLCLRNFSPSIGFGLACMVLLSLPVIKLLIPPVAVVGGTMLFARIFRGDRSVTTITAR